MYYVSSDSSVTTESVARETPAGRRNSVHTGGGTRARETSDAHDAALHLARTELARQHTGTGNESRAKGLCYTWPGASWRPSACEADVIATRPQVLHVHCSCVLMSNAAEGRGFLWQPPEYTDTPPCITAVGLPARRRTLWRHALGRWRGLWLAAAANSRTVKQDYCHQHLWSSGYDVSLTR